MKQQGKGQQRSDYLRTRLERMEKVVSAAAAAAFERRERETSADEEEDEMEMVPVKTMTRRKVVFNADDANLLSPRALKSRGTMVTSQSVSLTRNKLQLQKGVVAANEFLEFSQR